MVAQRTAIAPRGNLPDALRKGAEALSGIALDDVRVHYNSAEPAKLGAVAHARGSDIHLAPGQERHLPHEAWHVVQQKQGRVRPTMQLRRGVAINDNAGLEREADTMGARALHASWSSSAPAFMKPPRTAIVQRKISYTTGYSNKKALLGALYALFDKTARRCIDTRVKQYERTKWSITSGMVFTQVAEYVTRQGFKSTFATTTTATSSVHGPQLPTRVNRKARNNPKAALSTFNFPSVTLARAVLSQGKTVVNFHDRQVSSKFHAEDGIIQQLDQYIQHNAINTKQWKFNLTINNFFCTESSTTKCKAEDNCLHRIIKLHQRNQFANFHVYFNRPYGDRKKMPGSIRRLQAADIQVTAFSSDGTPPKYVNSKLDAASDSESEEEPSRIIGEKRRRASQSGAGAKKGRPSKRKKSDA
jgi:hypothetical protein